MNDIEKLFKEKIQHYPVTPPAEVWETLQDSLQQQRQKKKAGWWWMAASIVLLATAGAFFYLNNQPTVLPESRGIANNPVVVQPVEPLKSISPGSDTESEVNHTAPLATVQPKLLPVETTESSVAVVAQTTRVINNPERMRPVARLDISPLEEENTSINPMLQPKNLIAIAKMPVESTPTVTIIYKSGGEEVKEENTNKNPLTKAANFLASIKENGVGFSELRSAKSEIISKAFSSKRDPIPAE
ncbi:MAG: hypothetical protein ACFB15_27700 [Cyclobacteriaceae bacterium]